MEKILVVDDELNMRRVLEAMLKKDGYSVITASDGIEGFKKMKQGPASVVITDLKMPNLDGMGLLERMADEYPSVPVIMITAHGTISTAVDALKKGAFDYITKPFEQDDLKRVVGKALKTSRLNASEIAYSAGSFDRFEIIGKSETLERILQTVRKVAHATTTVLIGGETGTGKELIAHAIHRNSPRRGNPFIKINCAAISENLVESELFGYEKGAFTGAVSSKPGRFELADHGTLFLDEVGELAKDMQVKLLRVIQDQEFERVGGLKTIRVDVRLVAATNRNLLQDVKEGRFREDLFYRLNVFPIRLPALRERKEDIPLIAEYMIEKFNRKLERNIRGIDPKLLELFARHDWPGNIREMENLLERLVLIAKGDIITLEDLPPEVHLGPSLAGKLQAQAGTPFKDLMKGHMEEIERQMIERALAESDGNVTHAARHLGMSRKGLQLKMIKYNLRKTAG